MKSYLLPLGLLFACFSCTEPQKNNLPIPVQDTATTIQEIIPEAEKAESNPLAPETVIDTLKQAEVKPTAPSTETKVEVISIAGKWELTLLNKVKPDSIQYPRATPFLQIDEAGGKFSGSSGCNRIGGTLVKGDGTVQLSKIISTRMACRESNETTYMSFLNSVSSYKVKGNTLILKGNEGEGQFRLVVDKK